MPNRVSSYQQYKDNLNFSGIKFPVAIKDVWVKDLSRLASRQLSAKKTESTSVESTGGSGGSTPDF